MKTNLIDYKSLLIAQLRGKMFYFLLGLTVVFLSYIILYAFVLRNVFDFISSRNLANKQTNVKTSSKLTYTVQSGDHLWLISEKAYGSGYHAYDIAKANNLTNPSDITEGQQLILPPIDPKLLVQGETSSLSTNQVTLRGNSYTIKEGDDLWMIAEQAYGDGNMWTRIAEANNLSNPDDIHVGNVLTLPR